MRRRFLFGCAVLFLLLYFYPIFLLDLGIICSRLFMNYSNLLQSLAAESGTNTVIDSILGFLMSLITAGSFIYVSKSKNKEFPYDFVLIAIVLIMLVLQLAGYEIIKVYKSYVIELYDNSGYELLLSWSVERINETFIILGLLFGIKTRSHIAGTTG